MQSKERKTDTDDHQSADNSAFSQMELELLGLQAKNSELTKHFARVEHENCEMKNEILSLRRALVDVQMRHNGLEIELQTLTQSMAKCTPALLEILNLFLQVTDKRTSNSNTLSPSDRLSGGDCTPRAKVITHKVKPHTVNGTVLNLNPTISLTRLALNNDQRFIQDGSSNTTNRTSLPLTSDNNNEDCENEGSGHLYNRNGEFVSMSRSRTSTPLVTNSDAALQLDKEDDMAEELPETSQEPVRRLSAIQEESINSANEQTRTSLGEIRIYLSRLSAKDMQNRSCNDATEANVDDGCLSIETTVIENQETRVSKTLRADIMVFSPHTNSTRLGEDNSKFNDLGIKEERRLNVSRPASALPSTEVSPSSNDLSGSDGHVTPNSLVVWQPTPSLSAMGDINKSNFSRLDILKESRLSCASSLRSKTNRKDVSEALKENESPLSSKDCHMSKRASSFVTLRRGASEEINLTPIILLEKLENMSTECVHSPVNHLQDDPKKIKNIPNVIGGILKKSKSTKRSSSPKENVKRNKRSASSSLQGRSTELSIYVPNTPEPATKSNMRPSRAAKPKILKDASLKGKLRRMI